MSHYAALETITQAPPARVDGKMIPSPMTVWVSLPPDHNRLLVILVMEKSITVDDVQSCSNVPHKESPSM